MLEIDELVAVDSRVQLGKLLQRLRDGLQDERQEALRVDAGEVAFLDPGDGRNLAVRAREVLEHLPLHAADRLSALRGPLLRGGRLRNGANVGLGDAALGPAACDLLEVDAEL